MADSIPRKRVLPEDVRVGEQDAQAGVKKCSRCRVRRTQESLDLLEKYSTCISCRSKRKIVRNEAEEESPDTYRDLGGYLNRLRDNTSEDLLEIRYRGETSIQEFPRPEGDEEVVTEVYQHYARRLTELYIQPIMDVTGYKFVVRDYHKGGRKSKKITFMFVCSQDKGHQRKSRSHQERLVHNKLKTEMCESRVTLQYDLISGMLSISFTHKSHAPFDSSKYKMTQARATQVAELMMPKNNVQLPPIKNRSHPVDYNLSSVAQFTQLQFNQLMGQLEKPKSKGEYAEQDQAAQALAAVATSVQSHEGQQYAERVQPSQQHQNSSSAGYGGKTSMENIDKELLELAE